MRTQQEAKSHRIENSTPKGFRTGRLQFCEPVASRSHANSVAIHGGAK